MVSISCEQFFTSTHLIHISVMNTLDRISGIIMALAAAGVVIGLPLFAGIRDSKGLNAIHEIQSEKCAVINATLPGSCKMQ